MHYLALMSRGGEMTVWIVAIVFGFVYMVTRISAKEKAERRRLDLIERALDSGAIDEATQRELVASVVKRPTQRMPWLFVAGWIGLFVGVGLIVVGSMSHRMDYMLPQAIMVVTVSFAVLSLPIAAREFTSRTDPNQGDLS